MRKSNAEAAETRKRILAAASDMFLRNGISATAISDIMVAAGLTQGGFYRHFESKEHLVAAANAWAFEKLLALMDGAVAGKPPREALDLIVYYYLHQSEYPEYGALCPLINLSSELRNADGQIKEVITEGYARFVKMFASYLMRLDYSDYLGVAESMLSILVGAVTLSQLITQADLSKAILTNAQNTITLILQNSATSSGLVTKPTQPLAA